MIVLVGIAVFELFLLLLYHMAKTQRQKLWLYIIGCAALVLVVGLRSSETGSDTSVYIEIFYRFMGVEWSNIVNEAKDDYGFYFFTKFIGKFINDHVIYILLRSFVSLIGVFDLIWRNSKSPILSLYFYITIGNLFFVLTGIRQSIAMSICMFALRFVQKRKLVPFVLLVMLAAQFHHSAYIFLVMYFLGTRKVSIVNMLINVSVTIVAYFSYESLLEIANDVLDYDYGVEELSNGGVFFIILLFINAFAVFAQRQWADQNKGLIILNSSIIANLLWVFRLIGRTAERPTMYWLNAVPVALSEAVESVNTDKKGRVYIRLIVIAFTLLFFAYRASSFHYAFAI